MRKVLAVVIVAAICSIGVNAFAQIPNVQIYFDDNLQQTQGYCKGFGVGDTLKVVCNNFGMFMSTIEFGIVPPTMYALGGGDVHIPGALWLGTSTNPVTGVTITYPIPKNAFGPFVCMGYSILWVCDVCPPEPAPVGVVKVIPNPASGKLQAIEWQTFRLVQGTGMTSTLCPGVISTEESTWGRVKSLYAE